MNNGDPGETAAREQFVQDIAELSDAPFERRHEALMEWAEGELGLDRAYAESVYELALEEELEPMLAFEIVRSGLGVRELERPEPDVPLEDARQQRPPEWVAEETVELDDVELERRLRASFRRLRSHLDTSESPTDAVDGYLSETDVGLLRLR